MSEAYYRKWRPLGWESVIGQDHVVQTLQNAIKMDRIAHAYLFSGPRGTGKTSTARIIAKAVNCLAEATTDRPCNQCAHCQAINKGRFLDLIEIDAASNTSVDDVRSLREKINFSPSQGKYKVYIIDEVHMLSNAAFNALLKTLEEPPSHAIFVLATTEVHKIPATVLSRCQRHEFRRIPVNSIQVNLKNIAEEEHITIEPAALTEIARQATGSMRDAVSLLDQLASTGKEITLDFTRDVLGTSATEAIFKLVTAIIKNDAGSGLSIINAALDGGSDPRQFGRQVVDYLRKMLLVKVGNAGAFEASKEESTQLEELSRQIGQPQLLHAIEKFDRSTQTSSLGWQPSLQLELAVMQICDRSSEAVASPALMGEKPQQPANEKMHSKQPPPAKTTEKKVATEKPENVPQVIKKSEEVSTPPGEVDIDKHGIQPYWKEIKDITKAVSPETAALLNSCKTVKFSNGKIVLIFSSSILQSKMENGNNMEHAKNALKKFTGKDFDIRCEVTGKNDGQSQENPAVEQDGMIGAALSLGGKMTKEQ